MLVPAWLLARANYLPDQDRDGIPDQDETGLYFSGPDNPDTVSGG